MTQDRTLLPVSQKFVGDVRQIIENGRKQAFTVANANYSLKLKAERRSGMNERHAFRARWHDYNNGIYFVTICTYEKNHLFGKINNGVIELTVLGDIVDNCINQIPRHRNNAELWNYVVMPNHIHMVIAIRTPMSMSVGARYIAPTSALANIGCLKPPMHGEPCEDFHHNSDLASVVGTFKAAVTRLARARCATTNDLSMRARYIAPLRIWQRLYHEHIIRNQRAYDNIMNYIDNNIANWNKDCFYDN